MRIADAMPAQMTADVDADKPPPLPLHSAPASTASPPSAAAAAFAPASASHSPAAPLAVPLLHPVPHNPLQHTSYSILHSPSASSSASLIVAHLSSYSVLHCTSLYGLH